MPTIKEMFSEIADAIREKRGITTNIKALNFAEEIKKIDAVPRVSGDGEHCLTLIDNNGNVLEEIYLNEGEFYELEDLPKNNMIFEYWVSSEIINNNLIKMPNHDVVAGPIYTPESGKTEIYFELNKASGLTVHINMNGEKDWGDGTSDSTTDHTYTDYGKYIITCDGELTGTGGSYSYIIGNQANSNTNKVRDLVSEIRFGTNVTKIPSGALDSFSNLKNVYFNKNTTSISCSGIGADAIILPKNISFLGTQAFSNCSSIKYLVLPYSENISSYYLNTFISCPKIKKIIIPEGIKEIGGSCFKGCSNADYLHLPTTLETVDNSAFSNIGIEKLELNFGNVAIGQSLFESCKNLKKVILKDIVEIPNFMFWSCPVQELYVLSDIETMYIQSFSYYNLKKVDFTKCTKVINISFNINVSPACKIYVPNNLYDEWIQAPNWSTIANNIYKESEMEV